MASSQEAPSRVATLKDPGPSRPAHLLLCLPIPDDRDIPVCHPRFPSCGSLELPGPRQQPTNDLYSIAECQPWACEDRDVCRVMTVGAYNGVVVEGLHMVSWSHLDSPRRVRGMLLQRCLRVASGGDEARLQSKTENPSRFRGTAVPMPEDSLSLVAADLHQRTIPDGVTLKF